MFDSTFSIASHVAAAAAPAAAVPVDSSLANALIPLLVALPPFGFVCTAFFGRRTGHVFPLPLLGVAATWVVAMVVVATALTGGYGEGGAQVTLWTWIHAGSFTVDVGFHVDNLTAFLLIVVTTVGMLVHLYSVGYMAHDPGRWRFFAYLNLFMVIGGRVAALAWWFDRTVVDGAVNGIGRITVDGGAGLRRVQTGRVQNYALGIAIGRIGVAGSYLVIAAR